MKCHMGGCQKSARKLSRIIWMTPYKFWINNNNQNQTYCPRRIHLDRVPCLEDTHICWSSGRGRDPSSCRKRTCRCCRWWSRGRRDMGCSFRCRRRRSQAGIRSSPFHLESILCRVDKSSLEKVRKRKCDLSINKNMEMVIKIHWNGITICVKTTGKKALNFF